MNLLITSSIDLNIGGTVQDSYGTVNYHTESLFTTGQVPCDLLFWLTQIDKEKGKYKIVPCTLNADNTIKNVIDSIIVELTQQEALAADLPGTIYTKVAQKLTLLYGWTVNVENN